MVREGQAGTHRLVLIPIRYIFKTRPGGGRAGGPGQPAAANPATLRPRQVVRRRLPERQPRSQALGAAGPVRAMAA